MNTHNLDCSVEVTNYVSKGSETTLPQNFENLIYMQVCRETNIFNKNKAMPRHIIDK